MSDFFLLSFWFSANYTTNSQYYETAPSEQCRKLIALEFWYSDHDCPHTEEVQEIIRVMEETENNLGLEDWKHLDRFCGTNARKAQIRKQIEGLNNQYVAIFSNSWDQTENNC